MLVAYEAIQFNDRTIFVIVGALDIEIDSEFDLCAYPLYAMLAQR